MPERKPDDRPINRRNFFRAGFAELFKPLAQAVAPLEKMVDQLGALDQPVLKPLPKPFGMPENVWLRPPGSLPEKKFTETCSRCAKCVTACPVQAIKIDATGKHGGGAPFIDADTTACAVCDGLACMQVCPTGALQRTVLNDIKMGTAVWREETCLRTPGRGLNAGPRSDPPNDCRICVDHCPLGEMAITLKNGEVAVNPLGCIGCGVCQQDCPTTPKSIFVIPIGARRK